jgi:hypothetical protein
MPIPNTYVEKYEAAKINLLAHALMYARVIRAMTTSSFDIVRLKEIESKFHQIAFNY